MFDQDRLTVVYGPENPNTDILLICVVRNEMYFLPEFLAHYRALGVSHFVFLDDESTDGTTEFLFGQPDITVVSAGLRFGDPVTLNNGNYRPVQQRAINLWRTLLHRRFQGRLGTVNVDADEFLQLPPGQKLRDLAGKLNGVEAQCVWGAMIDVYPERLSDLEQLSGETRIDVTANWQFDAVPHLSLRSYLAPRTTYFGSKARLLEHFGVLRVRRGLLAKLQRKVGFKLEEHNSLRKPVFLKDFGEHQFFSAHKSSVPGHPTLLIPLVHYKFSGALMKRMTAAIREKTHYQGSRAYEHIKELLERMQAQNAPFSCEVSQPISVKNLLKSGNLVFD